MCHLRHTGSIWIFTSTKVLCKHVWIFGIKDVSFKLSVVVVGVLTECYPSRRYRPQRALVRFYCSKHKKSPARALRS